MFALTDLVLGARDAQNRDVALSYREFDRIRAATPGVGDVSAIFGLSFFGLMPIAGLMITGLSDWIGMRPALAIAAVLFGIGSVIVLTAAGRTVCECPETPVRESETAAAPATVV